MEGVLKAYQLTPKVNKTEIFENSKQWGAMFYVRPDYTSTTDPVTGWRKTIYISNNANKDEIINELFTKNKLAIDFDKKFNCYKFSYNKCSLYAFEKLQRFYYYRNQKNSSGTLGNLKEINLYNEFNVLFSNFNKTNSITGQIQNNKNNFNWKSFIFYWNLLNQIRNTNKKGEG